MTNSPAVLTPEVLPPETSVAACVGDCEVLENSAARARDLQNQIEFHALSFAYARIAYGLELLKLKEQVGRANWVKWYRENLERPRFALRNAQLYMQTAKAFLAQTHDQALLTCAPSDMEPEQLERFRESVAEITTAGTWHQLELDLGLARAEKARGGDHGGGKANAEAAKGRHQVREQLARDAMTDLVGRLRELVITEKHHNYLPQEERRRFAASLQDVVKELKKTSSAGRSHE